MRMPNADALLSEVIASVDNRNGPDQAYIHLFVRQLRAEILGHRLLASRLGRELSDKPCRPLVRRLLSPPNHSEPST
jgi:hypothetical protein